MKKTLSIILAILMIVTMLPFTPIAFAADDYAVVDAEAGTVTIDGTLGGKTTATEDDVNALVEKLKGYVDSGITTIIVTGSEPALHNFYDIDTPAVSAALYYLADNNYDSPYCGTIDLILPDVTEIVDDEFNNTFALNSITLPKVTKLGDLAFYACCFIQTIAFGSVVTDVEEGGGVMFAVVGQEVGGCDLILNCGQMNSSYIPDLDTNTWKFRYENEFKSITLTHTGGEATCIAKATCETCGEEYGEFDANKHTLVQKDAKAPTCTEIGWDAYESCTECDYTTYEVLTASHNIVTVDAKAPTCTEVGWEDYEYCSACDYSTYVELPASTHIDANCDYKCDYNCGYVYETLDFSDAKVLTAVDGALYIDGVEAETNSSKSQSRIYEGKYILGGDIETSRYIWIFGDTTLDLNGYTWNLTDKYINVNAPLSVYDTSEAETGKITSGSSNQTININNVAAGFNLYGGTIENTSISGRCALDVSWADVNLYAGKIKSNSQAICFTPGHEITINIDDTVIESGDDYADVLVALGTNDIAKGDIDVTDYKGDSLTAKVTVTSTLGKITVFKGIKNTQEAEKYQIIDVVCSESFDLFWEKTEYDEATGEKSIYTANNAFTQQPSAENNFTVDFNNPDATSQWYEVEEEKLGAYIVEKHGPLFSHDFKAGDILKVSTDSELRHLVIETGTIDTDYAYIRLDEYEKTATITFDADTTVDLFVAIVNADNPVEVNFTVFKETKLDGETEKTLQNAECGKSYYCKATVGNAVYVSDSVAGHGGEATCVAKAVCETCGVEFGNIDTNNHKDTLVQVDAKAPTCTEIGWDAYEYCTACDYTTYVEKEALRHSFTKYEVTEEAKCGVEGKKVAACDNGCGETDEKAIEALEHSLVLIKTTPAECGVPMVEFYNCEFCFAREVAKPKFGTELFHSFTKYEVTEEAKCGVEGKEVAYCDHGCGETDEKAIEALKHDIVIDEAVAPKCGETGLTQGEHCTRCDYKVEQEIVPALEHKDADGDYKCDNGCGHEFEKPAPEEPTPDTPDEPTDSTCDHLCHKSGILGFFWKIVKFFSKLFKLNPVCECGAAHY